MAKRGIARRKAIAEIELKSALVQKAKEDVQKAKTPEARYEATMKLVELEQELKKLRRATYGTRRKTGRRKGMFK